MTRRTSSVLYHCTCDITSQYALDGLYFCEECDAIRCSECLLEEVSSYYCPNCLFEVPTASVRAEKNRCARNCFLCPACDNTLSVVASDPTDANVLADLGSAQASVGQPPYYLSCMACRWDSRSSSGTTFEKPTGLASQLQKLDDTLPHHSAYEALKDHLEAYLRSGLSHASSNSHSHHASTSAAPTQAIAAAARALSSSSSALGRDIPSSIASASRFNSLHNLAMAANSAARVHGHAGASLRRTGAGRQADLVGGAGRDELKPFRILNDDKEKARKGKERSGGTAVLDKEKEGVGLLRSAPSLLSLSRMEKRWSISHAAPLTEQELKPLRIPLKSKKTKRCDKCKHIVVKPDSKAASTKYKIRLLASTYLPSITVHRRLPPSLGSRLSAASSTSRPGGSSSARPRTSAPGPSNLQETLVPLGSEQDVAEPLRPGRQYVYNLTFTNPLYEGIEVELDIVGRPVEDDEEPSSTCIGTETEEVRVGRRQIVDEYAIALPARQFGIDAFAEEWEYEEDEDEDGGLGDADGEGRKRKSKRLQPGVLAKKGNKTVVQLEVVTTREAVGEVIANLRVSYTYTAEDAPALPSSSSKSTTTKNDKVGSDGELEGTSEDVSASNVKTFTFYASITLGRVVPRTGLAAGSVISERDTTRRVASGTAQA